MLADGQNLVGLWGRVFFALIAVLGALALASVAAEARGVLGSHGSPTERALATRLRPRLLFDSRERWRPLEIDSFLSESFVDGSPHRACWNGGTRPCEPLAGPRSLRRRPGAPDYLDIHGEARNGVDFKSPRRACRGPVAVDCNGGRRSVIYYRRTTHDSRWYWDYWWFFRYNDYTGTASPCIPLYCSDHEGDWEGVTVVTTAQSPPEILAVIYAAHKERVEVEGAAAPRPGGHPLVFVAEGTHASYPSPCSGGCSQYATRLGLHLPEDSHDGAVVWGNDNPRQCAADECVRPLPGLAKDGESAPPRAGSWAGWHGQWGETCHGGCISPFTEQASPGSPGNQPRFRHPWVATRRVSSAANP